MRSAGAEPAPLLIHIKTKPFNIYIQGFLDVLNYSSTKELEFQLKAGGS
jgi:hypothetical protein